MRRFPLHAYRYRYRQGIPPQPFDLPFHVHEDPFIPEFINDLRDVEAEPDDGDFLMWDEASELWIAGQAGAGVPTVMVAASDARTAIFEAADYQCDGTADELTLIEACAELNTLGGGRLVLTEGTFNCSDQWDYTFANDTYVEIVGMGRATVITQDKSTISDDFLIDFAIGHGLVMQDFHVAGNSTGISNQLVHGIYILNGYENIRFKVLIDNITMSGISGKGVHLYNCDKAEVRSCWIKGTSDQAMGYSTGTYFGLASTNGGLDLSIHDNVIEGFNGNGVYLSGGYGYVIESNRITDCTNHGLWSNVLGGIVAGNIINQVGANGIHTNVSTGGSLDVISNNTITNAAGIGIYGEAWQVCDNYINGTGGNGIQLDRFIMGDYEIVAGNSLEDIGEHGISCAGLAYGGVFLIEGNLIVDVSQDTTDTYDGIHIAALSGQVNRVAVVSDNLFWGTDARYCIWIEDMDDLYLLNNATNGQYTTGAYNLASITRFHGMAEITTDLAPADNEVLAYDSASGEWINQTAAEAGLTATGHTHVEADVTDLAHTTDHGALGGLADDDHTQYLPVDGSRAMTGPFMLGSASELTISSGEITVTKNIHTVDTEADAASDDLDTINGGAGGGHLLVLSAASAARTVVVKHGTGNIALNGASDKSLDNSSDRLMLIYYGGTWFQIAFADIGV